VDAYTQQTAAERSPNADASLSSAITHSDGAPAGADDQRPSGHPRRTIDVCGADHGVHELADVLCDDTHPIYSEDFHDIVESFVVEATEILDNLDNKLLQLEENIQDKALVDEIFRDVHTVKGSAGFLNLQQMIHIAHHVEDVLGWLCRSDIQIHPAMTDVISEAFDQMKVLALQVKNQKLERVKQGHLIRRLSEISSGTFQPEAVTNLRRRDERALAAEKKTPLDTKAHNHSSAPRSASPVDPRTARGLIELSAQVEFMTSELQIGVMSTRMVPVGRIFNRYSRVVSDLARSIEKEVELVIDGAETELELDKSLAGEIGDLLVHLLRNAIDHGIERPAIRVSAGKPAVGTIRLVVRLEGDNLIIKVSDDGAGINVERVKRKAIDKNLITEAEGTEMSDADVFSLLFAPGFSTAEYISHLSGRGVGLDVVKTRLLRMNGTIDIQSEPNKGCSVTLTLPMNLV
jgi:two-component system chemotaxis sensor kinase CheA